MKNRFLALVLALLLCLGLAACAQTPDGGDDPTSTPSEAVQSPGETTAAPSPTSEPTPTAEPAEVPQISVLLAPLAEVGAPEGVMVYNGFYCEPEVIISGAQAASSKITGELKKRLADGGELGEDLLEAASDYYESLDAGMQAIFLPYSLDRRAAVTRGDAAVLSLLCSDEIYRGDSAGYHSYYGMSFDTSSGSLLTLGDIFADTGALKVLARDSVEAQAADMENADSFTGLREFVDAALDGEAWYLSAEGLELIAAEGEIAPAEQGCFRFVLPYAELEGLIRDGFLPAQEPETGAAEAGAFALSFEQPGEPFASLMLDDEADTFYLSANEDTAAFTLCRLGFDGLVFIPVGGDRPDEGLNVGRGYFWTNGLKAGQCLAVTGYFADTPNFGIAFDQGGLLVLAQSGKDGSLLIYKEA